MPRRVDFKLSECFVAWRSVGPGVTALMCFSPLLPQPIGTMYASNTGRGQGGKERVDVLDCWTTGEARRRGVMSLILDWIFRDWGIDVVVTQAGSKAGGEAWLRAKGFQIDPNTGMWFLNRPEGQKP